MGNNRSMFQISVGARRMPLFVLIGVLASSTLFAQKSVHLAGKVYDRTGPLEYVTITLSKWSDTSKVQLMATSDSLGSFAFEKIVSGEYQVKYSLIGYLSFSQKIKVSDIALQQDIPEIILKKDGSSLQAVTVTGQKKLIQKTPQGFIVNAAATITATGGTATDILKNTPTISVDAEGAITLRGKTPLILINGRNSTISNPDQIPASSIESIEIINNPTAKYDANAESGIVNIILKKNKQNGTNGAIALGTGLGSRGRINSSLLINHKTKQWNFGLGYDNRFAGRTRKIDASRTNFNLPDNYLLNQDRNDERVEKTQNLKLNIDFSPNNKNSFSFEALGGSEGQDNDENLNSILYKKDNSFVSNANRHSIEIEKTKVGEFAFDYNRKFNDERKSMSVSITTSIENERQNTDITSQSLDKNNISIGNPYLQRTHNYEKGTISNAKWDYSFPVSPKGHIETGYKGIYRHINADYESSDLINSVYIVNTAASNIFIFKEQVHALYALYNTSFNSKGNRDWKLDIGVRGEQVVNDGNTKTNSTSFSNSYFKFFPTASLAYYVKPDEFWKFSYGKRINRPGLGQLNPFIDITDSLNPHGGNPNLKPEIIHAFEFGYDKEWTNFTFSSNLFYRYSINTIRQYAELQPNGASLSIPLNIGSATSFGLESIITAKPVSFYDFNASVTLYQQKLNGSNISSDAVQNSFAWNGKLINNFALWQGGRVQLLGSYISEQPTPQGKRIAQYFVDFGFQQKLGKGNARLGLTITDIFNSFKSGNINSTSEFYSYRYGKADTRAFIITFAYFFKSAFKEKLLENKFSTDY